jgi:ATP-binding cassette subfamily F protein uup
LEQSLCEFAGAILFTSHDRYFLRRVATQFLAFAGWSDSGTARVAKWIMTADLEQAIEASRSTVQSKTDSASGAKTKQQRDSQELDNSAAKPAEQRPKKLTYKDQFRQSELENLIPKWESERDALSAEINNLYASNAPFESTRPISDALARLNQTIDAAYDEFEQIISRSTD